MLNLLSRLFFREKEERPSPYHFEITPHSLIVSEAEELLYKGMYCRTNHGGFVFLCPAKLWPAISPWNSHDCLISEFESVVDLGWQSWTPEQFMLIVQPDHNGSPLGFPTVMGWLSCNLTEEISSKIAGILTVHFDTWSPEESKLGEACYKWGYQCRYAHTKELAVERDDDWYAEPRPHQKFIMV